MQVKTKSMGVVEVPENHLVNIPSGLFGFEEYTDFALIESHYEPFIWLQSVQDMNLAFLVIDPFIICDDYEADISDKELEKIGISDPGDVAVLAIVTIPGDGGDVTANLQGPLIINKKNRKCMQAILDGTRWTTKHNIVAAIKKKGGNGC